MTEIIVNGIVSLGAAFLGAWFAYRFNLRQQKKWDKERKEEELSAQREEQKLQLNYLQTYLYAYVDEFFEICQILLSKQIICFKIKENNYKGKKSDWEKLFVIYDDLSFAFASNKDKLFFTSTDPEFIRNLANVETGIKRFNSLHNSANRSLEKRKISLRDVEQMPERVQYNLRKECIDVCLFNINSEIYVLQKAVFDIDHMLKCFWKYVKKHDITGLSKLSYKQHTKIFVQQAIQDVINENKQ